MQHTLYWRQKPAAIFDSWLPNSPLSCTTIVNGLSTGSVVLLSESSAIVDNSGRCKK
jgi:hypothetical protein